MVEFAPVKREKGFDPPPHPKGKPEEKSLLGRACRNW